MSLFLLNIIASATDDNQTTTHRSGGRTYKFNSKHYSMTEAFQRVLKKDMPSNQCEVVSDALVIECPTDYNLVRDTRYPFCEQRDEIPLDYTCPGETFEEECYEFANQHGCNFGFNLSGDRTKCHRLDFGQLDYVCPDDEYVVVDGKKGKYCEKTIQDCRSVCPADAVRDHETNECIRQIPVLPPTCPPDFHLSPDETYCTREVTRSCKGDTKTKKHGDRHLRRLDSKKSEESVVEEEESHRKGKYVQQFHSKSVPDHEKYEPQFGYDKLGYKVADHKHATHAGDKAGVAAFKKSDHIKGKSVGFVDSRLIGKGLCTYEEIAHIIPMYVEEIVPEIEECNPLNDIQPVDRVCEQGYALVEQKGIKEPACIREESVAPICEEGETMFDNNCYVPLEEAPVCQIGYRMNNEMTMCMKSDIVPPKYQWLLARQCEGYKCIDYYEHSCMFK